MRKKLILVFLLSTIFSFSQKKAVKQFQTQANEINIYTAGLDNLVIENSKSNFVEVYLVAESYDGQLIEIKNSEKVIDIKFMFEGTQTREVVFRKFITKRLQRANVVVKIPEGKKVFIFGENVDIESKDFKNDLAIYIENGIVKLNKVQAKTTVKLYSGNVYASVKNTNIDVTSNNGKIEIDGVLYQKKYQKKTEKQHKELKINSIRANVFLDNF